jgi:Na+-transporting NADH:ubiquinone oxidoreductase subunit C
MKKSLHTISYAAVLGTACALLLTGAGRFTAPYREANAKAEEVRNILKVLDVPFELGASSQDLLDVFKRCVRQERRGDLTLYIYEDPDAARGVQAIAVPFAGQGLWGPIRGFLALKPDMKTIQGVTFHQQEETPGLGGEIGSDWFRDQFKGKTIEDVNGRAGIRILRGGSASGPNEVHAITGATMTSERVEKMLNAAIMQIAGEDIHHGQ